MENYLLVAKKLNLPENTITNTQAVEPTPLPVVEPTPGSDPEPILDKKSITIIVLNITSKKGVASTLAKALEY